MMTGSLVTYRGLTVSSGENTLLGPLDFELFAGETVALFGPSGCGKTTLCKLLIRPPARLVVTTTEHRNNRTQPVAGRAQVGYTPQEAHLFRWATARQNIEYGLRLLPAGERHARLKELSAGFELEDGLLGRYPPDLSGGERQRVALARAIAAKPRLAILDEPLGSVDPMLRYKCQDFLLQDVGAEDSCVVVSHDIEEAVCLSDRVVILEGRPGMLRKIVLVEKPRHDRSGWRYTRAFDDKCAEVRAELGRTIRAATTANTEETSHCPS